MCSTFSAIAEKVLQKNMRARKQPLLLTLETLETFLKHYAKKRLPFVVIEVVERDEVSKYANNNYLWRVVVRTPRGRKVLFVKQARAYNRHAWEAKGKKLVVDPLRMCGEYQLMTLLQRLWGKDRLPEIYYFDPVHCIMVMSDVGKRGTLLIDAFAKEQIHPELGVLFGQLFGRLHATTYRHAIDCCGSPRWRKTMMRFFGFWWIAKGIVRYVSVGRVRAFYASVRRAPYSWIWGDPVYRNIFVKPGWRVTMVDFDHAIAYDPAMDCGIFLAQWMWMGLKSPKLKVQSQKFLCDFWEAYTKEFVRRKLGGEVAAIYRRMLRWAGIYLVSRTDGRSGSYFAQWPRWEKKIRALGISLFLERG